MKHKYLFTLLLIWLFACLYFFILIYNGAKEKAINDLNARQMIHARQAKISIEDFFKNAIAELNAIAESDNVIDLNDQGQREIEFALKLSPGEITSITRVDNTGKIIYTAPYIKDVIDKNISYQAHIQKVIKNKIPVISDVFTAVQGYRAIALHVPIVKNGEFKGTLAALINFLAISKRFLKEIRIGDTGYAWMTSKEGIELYCPVPGHTGNSAFVNCEEFPTIITMVNEMIKGHQGVTTYIFDRIRDKQLETVKKHAVYLPVELADTYWSIVVASSEAEILSTLISFKNRLILIFALLLAGSFFFSYYGVKSWGIVREEASRKRAEEELELVFCMSLDMICIADIHTSTFLKVNPAFTEILGFSEEELLAEPFSSFIHPDDIDSTREVVEEKLRVGAKVINFDNRYRCKDGTYRWLSWVSHPNLDKGITYAVARDITDWKKTRKALEESKALLESTGRLARVGGWELDARTQKVSWTKETYYIHEVPFDYQPPLAEAIKYFHPDDRERLSQAIQSALQDGRSYDIEIRFITAKGRQLWTRTVCKPEIEKGEVVKLRGAIQDITERKLAERESLILKTAINQAPIGVALADENINIYYCNPEGLGMRGGNIDQLVEIPKDAFENWQVLMLNGEPYEVDNLPLVRAISQGKIIREDFIVRHQDGTDHICDAIACPIYEESAVIGGIVVFLDVTRRKEIEDALRKSDERLKLVLDSVNDAVWDWRVDTGEVYFSSRWYTMLGYAPYELPQSFETWRKLLHPDDLLSSETTVFQHLELSESFQIEFRMRTKDNQWRWILARGKTVETDDQGKAVRMLGTHMDITGRKKLEERIQQSQKMESIGSLAGGIAHDFNNILFPIVGMAEILMEDLPPESMEYENAKEILKAGRRGSDLVKQILTFSRQSEHKKIPIRVQSILKEVLKLMRSTIPSSIDINQDIQPDCGLIMADPTQIHQVTMNLMTNAYHAIEGNGGEICVQLKEKVLETSDLPHPNLDPGKHVILSVSDTGQGIPSALVDKIFDPYFTTKEQGKGTGLGLAMVHGIVREHKGAIKVYSEEGKGSTFIIYLPLMDQLDLSEPVEMNGVHPTGNERILLVDDEESILKIEKQMLERLGYDITERNSSPDALQAFKSKADSFDLVITDMTMPNMSGDQLAKELRSIRPDIPVIICTGFSDRINQEKAKLAGIKGFLMKPVIKLEMAQMIRAVLDAPKH